MTDEELRRLFEETRQQINSSAAETRRYVDESITKSAGETRSYVDESITKSAAETRSYVDESITKSAAETRGYVDQAVARSTAEMRRHFDVYAEDISSKFAILAEGLQSLDEKLVREISEIRGEMRRGFAETQAMIKFSHAQLDRRVVALEQD